MKFRHRIFLLIMSFSICEKKGFPLTQYRSLFLYKGGISGFLDRVKICPKPIFWCFIWMVKRISIHLVYIFPLKNDEFDGRKTNFIWKWVYRKALSHKKKLTNEICKSMLKIQLYFEFSKSVKSTALYIFQGDNCQVSANEGRSDFLKI